MTAPLVEAAHTAAVAIVREARARILQKTAAGFFARKKEDNSFVTDVDEATERFIRDSLMACFPDHDIIGEEFPDHDRGQSYRWTIDPIDGTHSFKHGIPLYGTMLCLLHEATPLVGVIDHPGLGQCYSAAQGLGAFCDEQPFTLPDLGPDDRLEDEVIALGERLQFVDCGREAVFDALMRGHRHARTYCDCFGHTLAARGAVGAMVDFNIRLWDSAASEVLIREAGGAWELVATREDGPYARYDLVFGKPRVVEWIVDSFL